jgi:hypothetical protein
MGNACCESHQVSQTQKQVKTVNVPVEDATTASCHHAQTAASAVKAKVVAPRVPHVAGAERHAVRQKPNLLRPLGYNGKLV